MARAKGELPKKGRLSEKEQRFCLEYIKTLTGTTAARAAGYTGTRANQTAYDLLGRKDIQDEISRLKSERIERTKIDADMVLERLWMIATADPNEISQFRRNACRYCHGEDHGYQWRDPLEFAEACRAARDKDKPEPDDVGGYGFDVNAPADPDCPRCNGNGYGTTFIADTRFLSPAARMLYAGMKETKDGIEAKMHDQQAALINVARHLGMFKDRVEHSGKIEVEKLSDADLEAQIAAYERGGATDGPET